MCVRDCLYECVRVYGLVSECVTCVMCRCTCPFRRISTCVRRPANLENVFRGTFRLKKGGLAGKKRHGWQGPH